MSHVARRLARYAQTSHEMADSDICKHASPSGGKCQHRTTSGAELTFAPQLPRALDANVKSKSSTSSLILLVVLRF
jgi:N-acetylmuramoyl-L-alanine amidase CwlA